MTITNSQVQPVVFRPPLLNPSPVGLVGSVLWQTMDPPRFLNGVEFWPPGNLITNHAKAVPLEGWCQDGPEKLPDPWPDPRRFTPVLMYAADECDMSEPTRSEVLDNVKHLVTLSESKLLEEHFWDQLTDDSAGETNNGGLVDMVGWCEQQLLVTGVTGVIHANAALGAQLAHERLLSSSGGRLVSPLGNQYVFGAGYDEDMLIATTPLYGWRTPIDVRETLYGFKHNQFYAIAERAAVVGYEQKIATAEVA